MTDKKEITAEKHSLPWQVGFKDGSGIAGGRRETTDITTVKEGDDGLPEVIARCQRVFNNDWNLVNEPTENAQYIVTACNQHYQLKDQRDQLLESLKWAMKNGNFSHFYTGEIDLCQEEQILKEKAARNLINKIESVEDKDE